MKITNDIWNEACKQALRHKNDNVFILADADRWFMRVPYEINEKI